MMNVKFDFRNSNILVTGASSGIGKKITVDLAEAGANVFAVARREQELNELKNMYSNIIPIACDVTDYELINNKIKNIINLYGKIDGFVGCAGISELMLLRVMDLNRAKNVMEVNFWANINLLSMISKRKFSKDGASFILISSIAAHKGEKGEFIYSATKAALNIVVRSLAKEFSLRKQRINTISFGWIKDTNITCSAEESFTDNIFRKLIDTYPLGLGSKEDASSMCLFLLSNGTKWITGTDFLVDGGHLA